MSPSLACPLASQENIAELLEGVDDDGSGELEFEEFVEILVREWLRESREAYS